MKQYLLFILLCSSVLAKAQTDPADFGEMARIYDSIFTADYYAKDLTDYNTRLPKLMSRYNALTPKEKETYKYAITNAYYNLACTYAVTGHKQEAVAALTRSGFDDYDHVLEDNDLDPLRDDPGFKKFVAKIKTTRSKYLVTLIKDGDLLTEEQKAIPEFTYQSQDDAALVALRERYDLDSVAGNGSEVSKIINLLHWVHNTIRHDGSKGNPDGRNAMNLLNVCTKENKTCNCRGLAITLNEVYLAAGFRSRFVTCLPKDTSDNDCHVITEVYSRSLRKWVWMDPTFDAYVMDEQGTLLGIFEVRNRLIHDRTLILNPDANWNHRNSQSKQGYLGNYMAKNLYRLEYPVRSEYNCDTWEEKKVRSYTQVRPVNYMPAKTVDKNKAGTYILYYTNATAVIARQPK